MLARERSYFDTDACRPFLHRGGEKGILLLHGFTGTVAHMRPLGDALFERGYTAMGVNLPGHATSEEDMARTGWKDWLNAADGAVAELRKHCKTVVVCGLSMGAVISLILASQGKADGCVSISAPMPQNDKMLPLTGYLWFLKPRITWEISEDRAIQLDQRYDKGYSGFPSRKGADLHKLIQTARMNLYRIKCPALVVQSTGDRSVAPASADTIFDGISSVVKRKLLLHDVPHVCTISKELPAIVDAVDQLMKPL